MCIGSWANMYSTYVTEGLNLTRIHKACLQISHFSCNFFPQIITGFENHQKCYILATNFKIVYIVNIVKITMCNVKECIFMWLYEWLSNTVHSSKYQFAHFWYCFLIHYINKSQSKSPVTSQKTRKSISLIKNFSRENEWTRKRH